MGEVDPDWPMPDELSCPECGEDYWLAADVEVVEDGEPVEAEVICMAPGCGHRWEWEAEDA